MGCDLLFQTQPLTLRRKRSRHGVPRADGDGVSGLRSKRCVLTCHRAIPLALACDLIFRLNSNSRLLHWTDCGSLQSENEHQAPESQSCNQASVEYGTSIIGAFRTGLGKR